MDLQVKDNKGKVVGSVVANDSVWRAESNDALLHQVVVAQQANKRRGTQDTQQRNEVTFSTRKIRPQKGTGQARQGSRRSPLLKGGGVAHGPHPRSYRQRLPKKMRRQALRIALSEKVRDEALTIVDSLNIKTPKSRSAAGPPSGDSKLMGGGHPRKWGRRRGRQPLEGEKSKGGTSCYHRLSVTRQRTSTEIKARKTSKVPSRNGLDRRANVKRAG